jgi:hypothetical protein
VPLFLVTLPLQTRGKLFDLVVFIGARVLEVWSHCSSHHAARTRLCRGCTSLPTSRIKVLKNFKPNHAMPAKHHTTLSSCDCIGTLRGLYKDSLARAAR